MMRLSCIIGGICLAFPSIAQVQKGNSFILGSAFFKTERTHSQSSLIDNRYPKIYRGELRFGMGHFVKERFALGASIWGRYKNQKNSERVVIHRYFVGGGLFSRYYVPLAEKFYFFAQGGFNIAYGENQMLEDRISTGKPKYIETDLGVKPGFVFFPTQRIGVELTFGNLGWSNTRVIWDYIDPVEKRDDGGLDISLFNPLRLGLVYFPGRRN